MTFDRATFFAFARHAPFGGRLTQQQVDGATALLDAWESDGDGDKRKLANILANVFHETGARMAPVRETFATSDAQAIRRLDAAWAAGQLKQVKTPYWRNGWFGRGPIQVTHENNYHKVGAFIGVDLVENPGLLMKQPYAARSAVVGMMEGLFTGKKLSDYFNGNTNDPVGARRIVNGTDKASLIAGYHAAFLDALTASETPLETIATPAALPAPQPVEDAAKPDGASLKTDKTTIGALLAAGSPFVAFAKPILDSINNPWAFLSFALLAVMLGLGGWLFFSGRLDLKRKAGA